jgi:hypothetical protein
VRRFIIVLLAAFAVTAVVALFMDWGDRGKSAGGKATASAEPAKSGQPPAPKGAEGANATKTKETDETTAEGATAGGPTAPAAADNTTPAKAGESEGGAAEPLWKAAARGITGAILKGAAATSNKVDQMKDAANKTMAEHKTPEARPDQPPEKKPDEAAEKKPEPAAEKKPEAGQTKPSAPSAPPPPAAIALPLKGIQFGMSPNDLVATYPPAWRREEGAALTLVHYLDKKKTSAAYFTFGRNEGLKAVELRYKAENPAELSATYDKLQQAYYERYKSLPGASLTRWSDAKTNAWIYRGQGYVGLCFAKK